MKNYRSLIAVWTLLSLFLVFFLYLNFSVWNSSYTKDDLEHCVRSEFAILEKSMGKEAKNDAAVKAPLQWISFIPASCMGCVCICILAQETVRRIRLKIPDPSPVALAVRMND